MIELYRTENNPEAEAIEEALKEMVLAHRVITVSSEELPEALPPETPLPALKDEGQIITGAEKLKDYMLYLKRMAFEWRKYQSDSCYIHEDGGNC